MLVVGGGAPSATQRHTRVALVAELQVVSLREFSLDAGHVDLLLKHLPVHLFRDGAIHLTLAFLRLLFLLLHFLQAVDFEALKSLL